jgi:YihY family inner membrane protein
MTLLAASLAYYAFVPVLSLLLFLLAVASLLAGDALADRLVVVVSGALTPAGEQLLRQTVTNAAGRGGATVVGLLVLLWSGLKLFRGLDLAFSQIYGVTAEKSEKSFPVKVRDAAVVFGGVLAGITAVAVAGVLLNLSGLPVLRVVGPLALPAALAVAFLPLYVLMPDRGVGVREAAPGALFAGVGWTLLSTGFGIYAATAGSFRLYGVIGGALLLVTWFYPGSLVLLLGAALNPCSPGGSTAVAVTGAGVGAGATGKYNRHRFDILDRQRS